MLIRILKQKSGMSILLVLCIMLLLMFISASVIVAASNTSDVMLSQVDKKVQETFVKELAVYFSDEVLQSGKELTGTPLENNPFTIIPQAVYDAIIKSNPANPAIEIPDIDITTTGTKISGGSASWIDDANITVKVVKDECSATIITPLRPADGVIVLDPIPGKAEIMAKIKVKFATDYKGNPHTQWVEYTFIGIASINDTSNNGKIVKGTWTLIGYFQ